MTIRSFRLSAPETLPACCAAILLAATFVPAAAGVLDTAWLKGTTDKDPVSYRPGEPMVFTIEPQDLVGTIPEGQYFLRWERTGDDGAVEKGRIPFGGQPFVYTTSLAKPGFVRLLAEVVDADGKPYKKTFTGDATTPEGRQAMNAFEKAKKTVFFDGGAGVDIDALRQSAPEPEDFDAFWARQKALLAEVPIEAKRIEVPCDNPDVRLYAVSLECTGPAPVTGYLSIPKAADSGKTFPARVGGPGYGVKEQTAPKNPPAGGIHFSINAHGMLLREFGGTDEYYQGLGNSLRSNGLSYGLDPVQNADPETAYFRGMILRMIRALQYVKTLPEWNGRDLTVAGGSQGGTFAIWGAGCGEGVTRAESSITGFCNMGAELDGRLRGAWPRIAYVPALGYFDPVNFAKRVPVTCRVEITRAGLGDYTCEPSGIAILWNNLRCPKGILWMQGSEHGYVPPKYEGRDFRREAEASEEADGQQAYDSKEADSRTVGLSDSSWRVLPVFGGGYVLNALIAPSDPNRWYTYVDIGGPYRSDDGGATWRPLHAGMPPDMRALCADHVRALSIDPRDADSFVMASGDRFAKPAGVYVTRDGGRTFRRTLTARFYGDGNRRWMGQCIARHPKNPDVLVCGEDWDGLFRSDDNGETWRCLGLQETWITDVRWDADNPERLYVCAPKLPMSRQVRPEDPRTRKTGFFRSDDGGATWGRSRSEDIPSETAQLPGSRRMVGLFGERHVRVSDNGGVSWSPFEEGLPIAPDDAPAPTYIAKERYQVLATGADFWLVGNGRGEIYRRGAADEAWRLVPRDSATLADPVAEHHHRQRAAKGEFWSFATLNVDPRDPAHWLATDWFDIWESRDAGRTWRSRVTGMSQLVPFAIACDPGSPDNILYGLADLGMSISNDGGKTFHDGAPITGANSIDWSARTPGLAYAVGGKRGVQFVRTRDGGRAWDAPRGAGLPAFRTGTHGDAEKEFAAYTVAVDPVDDRVFLCVSGPSGPQGGGVWVSADQGETFTRFSEGLPEGKNLFKSWEFDGGGEAGWTPQLVFGPDGSAVLSVLDGRCYWLDRAAGRWEPTSLQNPWCSRMIAADPHRAGRFLSAQGATLKESTDGGRTWRDLPLGLDWFGWCVAFDAHTPGLVVGANKESILVSRDGGRSFTELPDGLDYPTGVRRRIVVDRERLFGLTRGSGVWTRSIAGR